MEEETKRGPGRPPLRAKDAEASQSSIARARERAAKLRETMPDGDADFIDRFAAPPAPDGWTYQWKRRTIFNQEDPAYLVRLAEAGWEPVPLSRHPRMMPVGHQGEIIERDGMVLMERPAEIDEISRERERKAARRQVQDKVNQLNNAPDGQFARNNKGENLLNVKRSFERAPVPEE